MSLKNIPGPLSIPIWGTLYKYKLGFYNILEYHKVLSWLYKKYGPVVREKYGNETIIHIFEPEDAKTVFQSEGHSPRTIPIQKIVKFYREGNNLSPGLGNTNGEQWYKLRKAARHLMLQSKDVHHFLPVLNRLGDELMERISQDKDPYNHEIKDLRILLGKWSQESSGLIAFERRLGCLDRKDGERLAESVILADQKIFKIATDYKFSWPIYKYISTPRWNEFKEAADLLTKTVEDNLNITLKKMNESVGSEQKNINTNSYHFLSTLLSKPELSVKDVMAIVLSLYEDPLTATVANLLYTLYLLAVNPSVQEKAYREIKEHVRPGEPVTAKIINELNYLKCVVKESMRLYPIGTEVSRTIDKDLVVSGFELPKDTNIDINTVVQYRSEKYFKDPDLFRPERWLKEHGEVNTIHPYIVTQFGFGPRSCIGRRISEQNTHLMLTKILQKFKIIYPDGEPPMEQIFNALLFPKWPVNMKFIERAS